MRILHTSDWHVGKVLKGRARHDEHVAVLGSIVRAARDQDVDVVLVAGDLFETAAPTPTAQGLVMRTLMALREDGRLVVAIAGNHDNQGLLDAVYRPVLGELGLHVLGTPKRPDSGGTLSLRTRGGEDIRVAALPFLSHRYAVRAAEVLLHETSEHTLDYSRRMTQLVSVLTGGVTPDAAHVVMAHATPPRAPGGAAAAAAASRGRSPRWPTRSPPACSLPRRIMRPSATCTAIRRSPRPARPSTPARRWPSTSARRPTRASRWSSPRRPVSGPTSGRCRWLAAGR